jgi:hypothetical protein
MRSLKYYLGAALIVSVCVLGATKAADEKKEEWTIKKVMKFAHDKDEGKLAQAKAGTIKDEDKKKLVEAYMALPKLKPGKGDVDQWKKIAQPISDAAKEYGDGKDEKAVKLSKTLQCKTCHETFR